MGIVDDSGTRTSKGIPFTRVVNNFNLGDALRCTKFCNAVIDAIIKCLDEIRVQPSYQIVARLWPTLPPNSTFGRYLADTFQTKLPEERFNEIVDKLPKDFVVEIAKAGVRNRDLTVAEMERKMEERCYYHEHKSEADKCI